MTNELSELWLQHKQLKTREMNEARPYIYDEGYIHQFQPGCTEKNFVVAAVESPSQPSELGKI